MGRKGGCGQRAELEVPPLHIGTRVTVSPATPGWFRVKEIIGGGAEGIEGSIVQRGVAGQMCEE